MKLLAPLLLSLWSLPAAAQDFLSVHGSGTTNPAKCFWALMNELEEQATLPIRMTYRAIGSSAGQREFVNNNNKTRSAAFFGSGDLPMTDVHYSGLDGAGIEMLHLPIFIGAVAFFHSVPGVHHLNMTGEVLAKIYKHEITNWNDQAIADINPQLTLVSGADTTIRPVRRIQGSSSTFAAMQFMNNVAPTIWTSDLATALPDYPAWTGDGETPVLECAGSGGVTSCIEDNKYAIGYIDAGHGNDAGLPEVRIQNKEGEFLTTVESEARGGLESAERDILPTDPTGDFSGVSLINGPGKYTWPMLAITYLYVRKDLSFIEPVTRGAMIGFFKSLYDPNFVNVCIEDYDFITPSAGIQEYGRDAIAQLEAANPDTVQWIFENSTTQEIVATGPHVFSEKRDSSFRIVDEDELREELAKVEIGSFTESTAVKALEERVNVLTSSLQEKEADLNNLRNIVAGLESGGTTNGAKTASVFDSDFGDSEETQLKAALALSIISFIFWCVFLVYSALRFCKKP